MTNTPRNQAPADMAALVDNELRLALADDYEAGLNRALASGYEEFGPTWERRQRIIIAALRAAATAEPGIATPQEVQEACAQVADRAAERLEEKARDLFKQRGEFEVRAARDTAYDIAESIRALIPPTSPAPHPEVKAGNEREGMADEEITKEMALAGRKALAVVADRMEEAKLLATSSIDFWQRVGHEPANEIYRAMAAFRSPPSGNAVAMREALNNANAAMADAAYPEKIHKDGTVTIKQFVLKNLYDACAALAAAPQAQEGKFLTD